MKRLGVQHKVRKMLIELQSSSDCSLCLILFVKSAGTFVTAWSDWRTEAVLEQGTAAYPKLGMLNYLPADPCDSKGFVSPLHFLPYEVFVVVVFPLRFVTCNDDAESSAVVLHGSVTIVTDSHA